MSPGGDGPLVDAADAIRVGQIDGLDGTMGSEAVPNERDDGLAARDGRLNGGPGGGGGKSGGTYRTLDRRCGVLRDSSWVFVGLCCAESLCLSDAREVGAGACVVCRTYHVGIPTNYLYTHVLHKRIVRHFNKGLSVCVYRKFHQAESFNGALCLLSLPCL